MDKNSKILISGATGLIGSRLITALICEGYTNISILTRSKKPNFNVPVQQIIWDVQKKQIESQHLQDVKVVFNLVGENIADGLWTASKKARILDSRINSTNLILSSLKDQNASVEKFISSSAVGIYGDCSNQILNENSLLGNGYLAEVCKSWETAARCHEIPNMKTYCIRTGLVLSKKGGALKKMLLPFNLGLGGRLGSGSQFMSWIHIKDLVKQLTFVMQNDCKFSVYNAVSPSPVTNQDFSKALAQVLKRPCIFPVPKIILKAILGEMSQILLDSQRVEPRNFIQEGFEFEFTSLKEAIIDIVDQDG